MVNINNKSLYIFYTIFAFILAVSSVSGQQKCPRPSPPDNADLINWDNPRKCTNDDLNCNRDNGITQYQEYDKIHFACKENYQLASQLPYNEMSVTCGREGQWFPKIEELEKCVNISLLRKCNTPDVFRCKSTGRCISSLKRCNCDIDCSDGSDEVDCPKRTKVIYALPTGKKSSGIISSPGYPRAENYPRQFNCIYVIKTLPSNRIRVDFEEFDLPRRENKKCDDFVQIASVHPQFLTEKQRKKLQQKNTPIKKCGQNGFGMVYSNDNTITINMALGYGHKNPYRYYRGISLSWQVKNERDFYRALHAVTSKRDKSNSFVYSQGKMSGSKKTEEEDEKLYTLVLPMVIVCGVLSLIFLAFCLVRQMKKQSSKDNCLSTSNNSNRPLSSSMKTTSFTLTENNLAKFDETHFQQQHSCGIGQHTSRLNGSSSSYRRGCGGGGGTTKSIATGKCGSSQNSDLPRYIMSYDIVPATTTINPQQYSSSINNNNIISSNKNIMNSSSSSAPHRSRSNSPPTRDLCSKNSSPTLNSGVSHSNHLVYEQQQQRNKELQTRTTILLPSQQQQQQYSSSQEYTTSNSSGSSSSDNASSSSRPNHYQRADEGVGSCGGTSQSTATCSLCHQRRKNCHGGVGDRFLNYNDQQPNRRNRNSLSTRHHQHVESSLNSAIGSSEIPAPTTYSREVYEQPSQSPLSSRYHYTESTYSPASAVVEHSVRPVATGDDRRIVEQPDTFGSVGFSMKEEEEKYYSDWYPSYNEEYHSQRPYQPQQQHYPDLYDNSSQRCDDGFLLSPLVRYNNATKESAHVMADSFHRVEKHKVVYLEHEICETEGRHDGGFMNTYGGDYSSHPHYLMNTDRTLGGSLICTH